MFYKIIAVYSDYHMKHPQVQNAELLTFKKFGVYEHNSDLKRKSSQQVWTYYMLQCYGSGG
jgi:hypothetical protein